MQTTQDLVKKIRKRLDKTQRELGVILWPLIDPESARNRIAKYETGRAIPPGDIVIKLQEFAKSAEN